MAPKEMRVKAILARSTCKTRIPSCKSLVLIKKKVATSLKENKEYLTNREFIKSAGSIVAKGGLFNDENKPVIKSKLICGTVAKNVPITPRKTRTGKVYSRLSTLYPHKLPRHSQQFPLTPLSKKCLTESNGVKPTTQFSPDRDMKRLLPIQDVKFAEDVDALAMCSPFNVNTLVTEDEINRTIEKVPNLEDICDPAALISFNSTLNDSIPGILNDQDKIAEQIAMGKTPENDSVKAEKSEETSNDNVGQEGDGTGDSDEWDNNVKQEGQGTGQSDPLIPSKEIASDKILDAVSLSPHRPMPKLPDLNFNDSYSSRASVATTVTPDSSPLIPRIDRNKIFEQFQGFGFFKPVISSSNENIEAVKEFKDEKIVEDLKESENVVEKKDVQESPVDIENKFKMNIAANSPNITRRKPRNPVKNKKNEILEKEQEKPKKFRRNSIFPRQQLKLLKEKGGLDTDNDTATNVSYKPSSSSSLNDSVICLSPVPSASSSPTAADSQHVERDTESPAILSPRYEPPIKKVRGRPKKSIGSKKSPVKTATPSPQKFPPVDVTAEPEEPEKPLSYLEVVNGKVYATISRPKKGARGIPLSIEVHASLLVEPKESCLKKEKNQSWNGAKHFRWADWTKENELTDILEFESDEKYSFRKSTKSKRLADPYGDE